MKYIHTVTTVEGISKKQLWEFLTDIVSYPEHVPYLVKTHIQEPLKKGSIWYDVTRILWIPMKFTHKTLSITKDQEMSFAVLVPFRGYMQQSYSFEQKGDNTFLVVARAEFHLRHPIVHALVGPILHKRLRNMIVGTFTNLEKKMPNVRITSSHVSMHADSVSQKSLSPE